MARFYITTSIMYANAAPHIGFALELIQADAIARYRRMQGDDVRFLTGTDEHGTKVFRSAQAEGQSPQAFVDGIAEHVVALAKKLNISNTDFIRTSDQARHWPNAQELWEKLAAAGDLYKHTYEGYYCVGHEAFIRENELIEGLCPLHKTKPELIHEENWFFRLSNYRDQVRELLESDQLRIVPGTKKSEVLNLLKDAEDVSFSRPSEQLSWGIPVPGDASQIMYVWADALTNYLFYKDFWPADVHVIGKDILRFHAMIWPAMLLAAGMSVPKNIYVHGFITVDGQKMSKSLGNVIDPEALLGQWPADVVRYFLLREIPSTEDGDFSSKNLENRYASDLVNGLGNLVQRTLALSTGPVITGGRTSPDPEVRPREDDSPYHAAFNEFRLHDALGYVWAQIAEANAYLNEQAPWKKTGEARQQIVEDVVARIAHIATLLAPFLPETTEKIGQMLKAGNPSPDHLFPRK